MPNIPTYTPQVNPATAGRAVNFPNGFSAGALGREAGKVLQERGLQLMAEYDAVNVASAYNAFRDSARSKLDELYSRESAAAQGVQNDYKAWFIKSVPDITKNRLKNYNQRLAFEELASRRRDVDLNALARHEARQHQVHKKEAIEGMAAVLDGDIRDDVAVGLQKAEIDFSEVDAGIETFMAGIDQMLPGHDTAALKDKYRQTFRIAQVEELIDLDANVAGQWLETYRNDLGDAYHSLKKKLETESAEQRITDVYHVLMHNYQSDIPAAIEQLYDESFMQAHGLTVADRDRLVSTLQGEIAYARQKTEYERRQRVDEIGKSIIDLMAEGRVLEASSLVAGNEKMNANERLQWGSYLSSEVKEYTDWELFDRTVDDIHAGRITMPSQVLRLKYRGTGATENALLMQVLEDHRDSPDRSEFIRQAFEWYDQEFKGYEEMERLRPLLKAQLLKEIRDENLKGMDIVARLKEKVGYKDDLYRPFPWVFQDLESRAPVGETLEQERAKREEEVRNRALDEATRGRESREAEAGRVSVSIPPQARAYLENLAAQAGRRLSDEELLRAYIENKDDPDMQKILNKGL